MSNADSGSRMNHIVPARNLESVPAEDGAVHRKCMWMLYKPVGVNTDMAPGSDMSRFIPRELVRENYHHIGRLDKGTSGLLLLSCNGDDTHTILTSSVLEKTYLARVACAPLGLHLQQLLEGIMLADGLARATKVEVISSGSDSVGALFLVPPSYSAMSGGSSDHILRVSTRDGRYRVVRRMLAAAGLPVLNLHRERVGRVVLPADMRPGDMRQLDEVRELVMEALG